MQGIECMSFGQGLREDLLVKRDLFDVSTMQHLMDLRLQSSEKTSPAGPSSRILYDIPCKVCQDHSSGKHYGIFACDGCAGFFKRSIRRNRQYVCKARSEGSCVVDKTHRNQCRACRLRKCAQAGMNKDAVQHERGPRNSTLRRQMALYLKDGGLPLGVPTPHLAAPHPLLSACPPLMPPLLALPPPSHSPVLDLSRGDDHVNNNNNNKHSSTSGSSSPGSSPPPPALAVMASPSPSLGGALHFPPGLSMEAVCESAARLLFLNVKWAKSVPAFTSLPMRDQLILLEESWRELFILAAAQFELPLDVVMRSSGLEGLIRGRGTALLHDTLRKFATLCVDPHEYSCLRAIVLFRSERAAARVSDVSGVAALQYHTQLMLNQYCTHAHPDQPCRFGKLILLLPELKSVPASTIEDLFFRRTIGSIPIERIICDMYSSTKL